MNVKTLRMLLDKRDPIDKSILECFKDNTLKVGITKINMDKNKIIIKKILQGIKNEGIKSWLWNR